VRSKKDCVLEQAHPQIGSTILSSFTMNRNLEDFIV